jgi:hypothetical protein
MTTEELHDWMEDRLDRLESNIKFRCDLEHECITNLEKDVKSHDRWISSVKGIWVGICLITVAIWHLLRK